jgi:alpha-L-fucosidase
MKKTFLLLSLFTTAALLPCPEATAQSPSPEKRIPLQHGAHRIGKRTDADMQRWREHGLGQFIHWGVYAIPGGHWNGKYYGGAAEWIRSWKEMPKDAYDNLYKQFNPVDFDADHWARMAKDMGARYVIFTTKHHDGFCMWPSKYTDYTIASTPCKKDIVKAIVDAYTKQGIEVHLYFSIIDWHHKGYRGAAPTSAKDKAAYEEFKTFTRNQLIELLENYPEVKGLWFDGSWDKAWIQQSAWVDELGKDLRAMRPGLVIGSRFRADENGRRHYDTNGDLIDDYDQTWERAMPDSFDKVRNVDWDCVMTVPENQWGYHSDWRGYIKTSFDLVEMMVQANSMNGNFVINFGPDGKGSIRPEETKLAAQIGAWMKKNSNAIYGVSHLDWKQQGWGYYTQKDGKIYLSVFNKPIDNRVKIIIPRNQPAPVSARILSSGQNLNITSGGRTKQNESVFYIHLPLEARFDDPFVIMLEGKRHKPDGDEYDQAKT